MDRCFQHSRIRVRQQDACHGYLSYLSVSDERHGHILPIPAPRGGSLGLHVLGHGVLRIHVPIVGGDGVVVS